MSSRPLFSAAAAPTDRLLGAVVVAGIFLSCYLGLGRVPLFDLDEGAST